MRWNSVLAYSMGLKIKPALADVQRPQGSAKVISGDTLTFQDKHRLLRGLNEPTPHLTCRWFITVIDSTSRIRQELDDSANVYHCIIEGVEVSRNMLLPGWASGSLDDPARRLNALSKIIAMRYGPWKGMLEMPWQSKAVQ